MTAILKNNYYWLRYLAHILSLGHRRHKLDIYIYKLYRARTEGGQEGSCPRPSGGQLVGLGLPYNGLWLSLCSTSYCCHAPLQHIHTPTSLPHKPTSDTKNTLCVGNCPPIPNC